MLKKIRGVLSSMPFAIALLLILAAACAAGSVIPQGKDFAWYASAYSERSAAVLLALRLDDVFHSWWFLLLAGFLCLDLLLCDLVRLPRLRKRFCSFPEPEEILRSPVTVSCAGVKDAEAVFSALGMPKPTPAEHEGREALTSAKNRGGLWGAWICHLGILLLILGFGLGQLTHEEYAIYGLPGHTEQIGQTSLLLTIDDFQVALREDDTVEQYTAAVTVRDAESGTSESAETGVNHPADLFGYRIYQNSTGWAARVSVTKEGASLQETVLCAGEYIAVADKPGLSVFFRAFYPDYVHVSGQEPRTASGQLRNPAYLYAVYYRDELVGMNVLTGDETIKVDSYEIRFDDPQPYTVLQLKRDRFTYLALLGGLVLTAGMFLALYVLPRSLRAIRDEDGTWTVYGYSQKGGALFAERLRQAAEKEAN